MTSLLVLKERIKGFYGKNERYIIPVLKFIFAFVIFQAINKNLGYMSQLNKLSIVFILAIVCAFMPMNVIVIISGVLVLAHLFALSIELFVIGLILVTIMFLLYFRFAPKEGFLILLTPIASLAQIPFSIPIAMGLLRTPISAIPIVCGTIEFYFLLYVQQNSASFTGALDQNTMMSRFPAVLEQIFDNQEMYLTILAMTATIVVVYLVRRLSIDYAWQIAIVVGGITNILILLVGDYILDLSGNIWIMILGTVVSMVVGLIIQFFCFYVDFSRTEYVQFEDDEYYYYVKAVPKMYVAVPDKQIKRINSRVDSGENNESTTKKNSEIEKEVEFDIDMNE